MISVVIPMYNAEESIARCLNSVLKQTYKGELEIIVVNDGSTDRSAELVEQFIKEYPDKTITLINQVNGGVSKARNTGLGLAKGAYIALLDSDDEWLSNKLEKQIQIMSANDHIDFLGCSRNNEVLRILFKKVETLHRVTVIQLLIKMFPQTSTALFKRKLYDEFGGYNEQLTHAEDGELWLRYCANGNFYYFPDSLVLTGNGKPSFGYSGLSANLEKMQYGNEFILKEARKKGLITSLAYFVLILFSRVKYIRRIIITKLR